MGYGAIQVLTGATKLSELGIDISANWQGYQIRNMGNPSAPQDAATEAYVLEQIEGRGLIVWKDTGEQALSLDGQTAPIDWTELDLTPYTSGYASFAILHLWLGAVVFGAGDVAYFMVRKAGVDGSMVPFVQLLDLNGDQAGAEHDLFVIVGMASGQRIEYSLDLSGAPTVNAVIEVGGYIEQA